MTFSERLTRVRRDGNLTVADLARWFDRSYQTVRGWAAGTCEPGGPPMDQEHAEQLLVLLEGLVGRKQHFPVARMMPRDRIAYLRLIRVELLG